MMRKCSLLLTLAAWLLATGSHWDLVQTFAWGKMFANYSQTMSFSRAVKKTFSAEGMCGVCEIVQAGKKDLGTSSVPNERAPVKILCLATPPLPLVFGPALLPGSLLAPLSTPVSVDPDAPPIPPPRVLV